MSRKEGILKFAFTWAAAAGLYSLYKMYFQEKVVQKLRPHKEEVKNDREQRFTDLDDTLDNHSSDSFDTHQEEFPRKDL